MRRNAFVAEEDPTGGAYSALPYPPDGFGEGNKEGRMERPAREGNRRARKGKGQKGEGEGNGNWRESLL